MFCSCVPADSPHLILPWPAITLIPDVRHYAPQPADPLLLSSRSSFYVCLFLLMTQWFSLVLLIKYGHLTNSYNTEENVSPFGINHQLPVCFCELHPALRHNTDGPSLVQIITVAISSREQWPRYAQDTGFYNVLPRPLAYMFSLPPFCSSLSLGAGDSHLQLSSQQALFLVTVTIYASLWPALTAAVRRSPGQSWQEQQTVTINMIIEKTIVRVGSCPVSKVTAVASLLGTSPAVAFD